MSFDEWWARMSPALPLDIGVPSYRYTLPALAPAQLGTWSPTHADDSSTFTNTGGQYVPETH
jgi:hypothetical protein